MKKTRFVGLNFVVSNSEKLAQSVLDGVKHSMHSSYFFVNAYSVACSLEDKKYRDLLEGSTHNIPDGFPLQLLTKYSREPLNQIRGVDLMKAVLELGQSSKVRHFLLGSTKDVLNRLESNILKLYPEAVIAGVLSPSFGPIGAEQLVAQDKYIINSKPDIIWVALGTPKQDQEAMRLFSTLGITTLAVGAAFDFIAGSRAEAPKVLSKIGLEWMFRLATEPKRLWKRYAFGNITFMLEVIRWSVRK